MKIGQLQSVFTIVICHEVLPLCLIIPFDRKSLVPDTDKSFKFIRLQKQSETVIIPTRSILRGIVLFPAYDTRNEYIWEYEGTGSII